MQVYSLETIAKNMNSKEHSTGTSMSQMEVLRTINQCDTKIEARQPDIVLIDKTKKEGKVVDVTIPGDELVNEREVRECWA